MSQKPILLRRLAILFFALCPLPIPSQETKAQNAISRELEELFKADQAERDGAFFTQTPEKMGALIMRDARRRERVVQIVTKEVLSSAEDYYHAAMVLQHGDKPKDFLMAHELATVAAFRGHKQAPGSAQLRLIASFNPSDGRSVSARSSAGRMTLRGHRNRMTVP